jgi:ribosomal protein S18 acetylase RimI-like enzyme
MLAPLDGAIRSETDEYRALIARDTGAVIGLIVFGEIAGAIGAGRIYCVAVDDGARRRGIASALIEAACTELRSRGARFVAIEMAQDPRLDAARAVAARAGFLAEGRVSDYVRDGVDLVLFRRDFRETNNPA